MPPLPADSIHARACKLKCEKILTRPGIIMLIGIVGIMIWNRSMKKQKALNK